MKQISILGATGSIGTQTLDVIRHHSDKFTVCAISVGRNMTLAEEIIKEFSPRLVSVIEASDARVLQKRVGEETQVVYGKQGLIDVALVEEADVVVTAVVGSVGLHPTIEAIKARKTIALANKETLVTAGHLVMKLAKEYGVDILPVDSEHSAIFQCLNGENKKEVQRLILTASGGSFRDRSREELHHVTVEDALNHPNWSMGAKITIDSATMMNKGLEVIEAHWLYNIPYDQIDVLLHKESMIHSMVEFVDTSVMAQLGTPDMRIPIQYALTYPKRLPLESAKVMNLWEYGTLNFKKMDEERYPCMKLAYRAGRIGGSMPTVLNAANEVAVDAFLNRKISFLQIEDFVEQAMNAHQVIENPSLEQIEFIDWTTREFVQSLVN